MTMTQFLIWIIPPIFYFLMVLFFRKQVEYPHISRIWYWGTPFMFIPIFGLIIAVIIFLVFFIALAMEEIDFRDDTKFSKRWLD